MIKTKYDKYTMHFLKNAYDAYKKNIDMDINTFYTETIKELSVKFNIGRTGMAQAIVKSSIGSEKQDPDFFIKLVVDWLKNNDSRLHNMLKNKDVYNAFFQSPETFNIQSFSKETLDDSNDFINPNESEFNQEVEIKKQENQEIVNRPLNDKNILNRNMIDEEMRDNILEAWNNQKISTLSRLIYLIGIKCDFNLEEILEITSSLDDIEQKIIPDIVSAFLIFKDYSAIDSLLKENEKQFIDINDKEIQKTNKLFTKESNIIVVDNKIEIKNPSKNSSVTYTDEVCDDISDKLCDFIINNNFNLVSKEEMQNLIPCIEDLDYLIERKIIKKISEDEYDTFFYENKKYDEEFKETIKNRPITEKTEKAGKANIKIDTYKMMINYKLIKNDILSDEKIWPLVDGLNSRGSVGCRWESFINSFYHTISKTLLRKLKFDLQKKKILYIPDMPFINEDYSYILATFLSLSLNKKFQCIYSKELNSLILNDNYKYENIVRKVVDISSKPKMKYLDIINLLKECFPYANSDKIAESLREQKDLIEIENGYYVLQEQYPNQAHKVEFVYLMHPKKLGYKKDEYELVYSIIKRYFPVACEGTKKKKPFKELNSRNLEGFCYRSDNLLLWGMGGYFIHKNHISHLVDGYDFNPFIKWLDKELLSVSQISLAKFYEENKQILERNEIHNHHALHSLLELKYPDKYLYPKSPNVALLDSTIDNKIELLLSIMDKDKSYELSMLSKKMNTRDRNVRLLIDRTADVVAIKKELYKTRAHLVKNDKNIFDKLIENIIEYLNNNIEELIFIYPEHLLIEDRYKKNQLHRSLHQYHNTKYILLDILKKQKEGNKFQVINNNRIVSKAYLDQNDLKNSISKDLNYHTLIEKHLLNDKIELTSKELAKYFKIRGMDYYDLLIRYVMIDNERRKIVRVNKSTFILIKSLNITEKALLKLNIDVKEQLKNGVNDIETILFNLYSNLPNINSSYEWNNYLLHDILDDSFVKSINTPIILKQRS